MADEPAQPKRAATPAPAPAPAPAARTVVTCESSKGCTNPARAIIRLNNGVEVPSCLIHVEVLDDFAEYDPEVVQLPQNGG